MCMTSKCMWFNNRCFDPDSQDSLKFFPPSFGQSPYFNRAPVVQDKVVDGALAFPLAEDRTKKALKNFKMDDTANKPLHVLKKSDLVKENVEIKKTSGKKSQAKQVESVRPQQSGWAISELFIFGILGVIVGFVSILYYQRRRQKHVADMLLKETLTA